MSSQIPFIKMSGAGNDFVIFDARKNAVNLTADQIKHISNRNNIGCDQLIVIKNSADVDCEMVIYNSDGSLSGACGNATRCVASILMDETHSNKITIKTAANILKCWREAGSDLISVDMGIPKFSWQEIPLSHQMDSQKIIIDDLAFSCVNVGNPHAVCFINKPLSDQKFFEIGPKVETHSLFPQKTNAEFAQIISDNLINVRVWERGAGETLACGSGACAVGILAIKKGLIKERTVTTRFKGGDLFITWQEGHSVVMTGGYKKEFAGDTLV